MLSFNSKKQLSQFLAEDIGKGDITSALLPKTKISVKIISREDAIVAGTVHAKEIFKLKGCNTKILKKDGSRIKPNQTIMTVSGDAGKILMCERTALNLLTRMSGIVLVVEPTNSEISKTLGITQKGKYAIKVT